VRLRLIFQFTYVQYGNCENIIFHEHYVSEKLHVHRFIKREFKAALYLYMNAFYLYEQRCLYAVCTYKYADQKRIQLHFQSRLIESVASFSNSIRYPRAYMLQYQPVWILIKRRITRSLI